MNDAILEGLEAALQRAASGPASRFALAEVAVRYLAAGRVDAAAKDLPMRCGCVRGVREITVTHCGGHAIPPDAPPTALLAHAASLAAEVTRLAAEVEQLLPLVGAIIRCPADAVDKALDLMIAALPPDLRARLLGDPPAATRKALGEGGDGNGE